MQTSSSDDTDSATAVVNGVLEKTFQTWQHNLDPGKRWLWAEIVDGYAVRVCYALCTKHGDRLKGFRNFSGALITGISFFCTQHNTYHKKAYMFFVFF